MISRRALLTTLASFSAAPAAAFTAKPQALPKLYRSALVCDYHTIDSDAYGTLFRRDVWQNKYAMDSIMRASVLADGKLLISGWWMKNDLHLDPSEVKRLSLADGWSFPMRALQDKRGNFISYMGEVENWKVHCLDPQLRMTRILTKEDFLLKV